MEKLVMDVKAIFFDWMVRWFRSIDTNIKDCAVIHDLTQILDLLEAW